mmetsp:Transcript_104991/g.321680  ORF Transcript_104991/g.321680 Transcript_104991/m.321680 type:complete len:277 (-) Transcript_104991:1052-1882(-)
MLSCWTRFKCSLLMALKANSCLVASSLNSRTKPKLPSPSAPSTVHLVTSTPVLAFRCASWRSCAMPRTPRRLDMTLFTCLRKTSIFDWPFSAKFLVASSTMLKLSRSRANTVAVSEVTSTVQDAGVFFRSCSSPNHSPGPTPLRSPPWTRHWPLWTKKNSPESSPSVQTRSPWVNAISSTMPASMSNSVGSTRSLNMSTCPSTPATSARRPFAASCTTSRNANWGITHSLHGSTAVTVACLGSSYKSASSPKVSPWRKCMCIPSWTNGISAKRRPA